MIPDLIDTILDRTGYNQKELAYRLGVTDGAVSAWLYGHYEPKPAHLQQLRQLAKMPLQTVADDLGPEEDDPRATCPACGQLTIRIHVVDDLIGDPPMTGWITFLDGWTQECGCVLTDEQSEQLAEAASA